MPERGKNRPYFGDPLKVLREEIAEESVDLIYLDPPFNSNASYNVLFKENSGERSSAAIRNSLTAEQVAAKYPRVDEHGQYAGGTILCSDSMGPKPKLVYEYKGFTPGTLCQRIVLFELVAGARYEPLQIEMRPLNRYLAGPQRAA